MLKDFLDKGKCFELVCGAGNRNFAEITNLCALYSRAGCRFFDINASVEAVRAAKKGIELSLSETERKNCYICVSIGTQEDPHVQKCRINAKKCISCGRCKDVCIQSAIIKNLSKFEIQKNKCIGCGKCIDCCYENAITTYSEKVSFSDVIPKLQKEGFDCLEYHVITADDELVKKEWKEITDLYTGAIRVCIDRSQTGNRQLLQRLKYMKANCRNELFSIQADGAPMSGGADDFRTTLQSVATADIIDKEKITDYIFISGGTNSKTMQLAKMMNINVTGVAVGSYARKIVKKYIEQKDFLQNERVFNEALLIAKSLVESVNIK